MKIKTAPVGGLWNLIHGDPAVPKKEWGIAEYDITDPKVGQERVRKLNAELVEYYKRWTDKDGDYYSEIRDDVTYYRVQTGPTRRRNIWAYDDAPIGPETFDMLPERQAEDAANLCGRSFYAYYYNKPADMHFRYSLRKVAVEQDFIAREAARTDNPIRLPEEIAVHDAYYSYHMAEIIPPATISFYRSREDAWADKRTEMKLGRYLREYNPRLDDNTIADACAKIGVTFVTDVVLKMARTREEIRMVYENGPDSCMSGTNNVQGGVHPVECYASEDLAVAYLDRDGEITARTLVNPMKMQYLRIYGDNVRLSTMLEKLGYKQSNKALAGAKLLKIKVPDSERHCFLPYLDGNYSEVDDMGDHFVVYAPPQRYSGNTSGYISVAA
jgi:hypothetical protein